MSSDRRSRSRTCPFSPRLCVGHFTRRRPRVPWPSIPPLPVTHFPPQEREGWGPREVCRPEGIHGVCDREELPRGRKRLQIQCECIDFTRAAFLVIKETKNDSSNPRANASLLLVHSRTPFTVRTSWTSSSSPR